MVALVSLSLAVLILCFLKYFLFGLEGAQRSCIEALRPSNLVASPGDGEVTLTWDAPSLSVEGWQYRKRAQRGGSWTTHSTGSTGTSYVVQGLANGVDYKFRVRASSKPNSGVGCWSAAVASTPVGPDNVLERMAAHQAALAEHTRAMAKVMTDNGKALRELGGAVVGSLQGLVASSNAIATQSAGIKVGVNRLADSVNVAGDKVAAGLAEIAEQVESGCDRCVETTAPCGGAETIGSLLFEHDSHHVAEVPQNGEAIRDMVAQLRRHGSGLVLTEGHATSVGLARHNLHLSDLRAACASQCLRARLGKHGMFGFREVARGEALDARDLTGSRSESRRVDVTLCEHPVPSVAAWEDAWPHPLDLDCGCPPVDAVWNDSAAANFPPPPGTATARSRHMAEFEYLQRRADGNDDYAELFEEVVGDLEKLGGIEGFGQRFDQYELKGTGQS